MIMLLFRALIALALIVVGVYWLVDLLPIQWSEFKKSFTYDKADSQKSMLYSAFFAVLFIAYGIFEIINVIRNRRNVK